MSTQTATKPSLTIKRRFNAPPAKVYAAWTDPQMIARWFGPAGVERVEAKTDLRVGGRYHITMHVPGDQHDVMGVYREVVPNEKGSSSPGPGRARRSASRWSRSRSSPMARARC